jgi:ribosome biogenesis protein Tsr3
VLAFSSRGLDLALSSGTVMVLTVSFYIASQGLQSQRMLPDLAAPDMIKFGIESKFSCAETSTKQFKELIASALEEMQAMCQNAIADRTTQNSHIYSSL